MIIQPSIIIFSTHNSQFKDPLDKQNFSFLN